MMGLIEVIVAVVILTGSLFPKVCQVQQYYANIQVFIEYA